MSNAWKTHLGLGGVCSHEVPSLSLGKQLSGMAQVLSTIMVTKIGAIDAILVRNKQL